ncbi:MAG: hypothetical protein MUE34_15560 [Acidimicrobiales bacterium]|nr:hypothetical protein [Acidimicrobiales bacterium]
MTTAPEPPELQAWRDLCRRLEAVGEQLLSPPFPGDPADRVEGFDHLADQVLCWLGWSIGHPDPRRPFFMRQNDLVTQWGGPNADNVYRHARIDPSLRYRIRGRMHGCEDFILALRAGFMHQAKWGTLGEHTASDLGIGRGDEFEILLGGDEPGALPIPDDVVMVSIREYYLDWAAEEPAFFTIECLDTPAPLPRRTGEEVAARFAEAAAGVEVSMAYWNRYMTEERGKRTDNAFAGSFKLDKGLSAARYGFCFFDLDPDEALIVETDKPEARYWSLQLYVPDWFVEPHPVHRVVRRPAPGRGRPRRPRRRQLAGHRRPTHRPVHAAVVLADRRRRPRARRSGGPPRRGGRRPPRGPPAGVPRRARCGPRRPPYPPRPPLPHLSSVFCEVHA